MLAEKFQVLSQREKVLGSILGMAVLIAGLTYVLPFVVSQQPASASVEIPPITPNTASKPVITPAPKLNMDNLKNPFNIPPVYQVKNKSTADHAPPGNRLQSSTQPVLHGVISNEKTQMAILEWHGQSETLGVDGSIGEYTVTAIVDNQVMLDGPEGQVVLTLGRG